MEQKVAGRRWLLIPVCALALILVCRPWHSNLIQRSKRIATFDAVLGTHCIWISDHRAIYMRYRKDDSGFELAQIDADSGKVTPVEALNRKYAVMMQWLEPPALKSFTSYGRVSRRVPTLSVSPDGRWLVFCTWPTYVGNRKTEPCRYLATNLDGTQEKRWDASSLSSTPQEPYWLHDGHRCLEPIYDQMNWNTPVTLRIHDLDRPELDQTLILGGGAAAIRVWGIAEQDRMCSSDVRLHGFGMPITPVNYTVFVVPGLSSGNRSIGGSAIRVDLPIGTWNYDKTLSLHGDRVAWELWVKHSSWADRLRHYFRPSVPLRSEEQLGIWVTDLNGSHWSEVGYLSRSFQSGRGVINQVQWLPGGKQISFLYGDGLYTVPAP